EKLAVRQVLARVGRGRGAHKLREDEWHRDEAPIPGDPRILARARLERLVALPVSPIDLVECAVAVGRIVGFYRKARHFQPVIYPRAKAVASRGVDVDPFLARPKTQAGVCQVIFLCARVTGKDSEDLP